MPNEKKENVRNAISLLNDKKKAKQGAEREPRPIVQEVKPRKKIGRPTSKDPNKEYVRLSAMIPASVKKEMRKALATDFDEVHDTQDEFVSAAIRFYIQHYNA